MHQITGFVEGFMSAYPCRMCKIQRTEMVTLCRENVSLRRNVKGYEIDLSMRNTRLTGVKSPAFGMTYLVFIVVKMLV